MKNFPHILTMIIGIVLIIGAIFSIKIETEDKIRSDSEELLPEGFTIATYYNNFVIMNKEQTKFLVKWDSGFYSFQNECGNLVLGTIEDAKFHILKANKEFERDLRNKRITEALKIK